MSKLYQEPNSPSDSKRFLILPLIRLHLLSLIYDVSSSTQLRMQRCDVWCQTHQCSHSEGCMIFMFVEELVPHCASIALILLLLILCSTNLYWKEKIPDKWNITVNSTHRYFLLCLLPNCGKENTHWDFRVRKQRSRNKKKGHEFHMILRYTMLFICKAVYLSIV